MSWQDRELVVQGAWSRSDTEACVSGGHERVVLNHALGFEGSTVEFLSGLPIKEVVITAPVTELEPLYETATPLVAVSLRVPAGARLELGRLPELTELVADWEVVKATLAQATTLTSLYVGGFGAADLSCLAGMGGLESLRLKDRPRVSSLAGLPVSVRQLQVVGAKKLKDFSALAEAARLEDLELQDCSALSELDVLVGAPLRRLTLSDVGTVASLAPLASMSELEFFEAMGSTRIADNDLSPLLGLHELREVHIGPRRSYRPSVAEVVAQR